MTHLLVWLLLFPLVSAVCTALYARTTKADLALMSRGYATVYVLGTLLLLTLYYV
jgi:hypothetical protein